MDIHELLPLPYLNKVKLFISFASSMLNEKLSLIRSIQVRPPL